MTRKQKFIEMTSLLNIGSTLNCSFKCKIYIYIQKHLNPFTLTRFHLVTFQIESRQCRHCFTCSWQQKYLGCAITYGAIWWEIIQPVEYIGRQASPKVASVSWILQGAESLVSCWLQWELKADKKLQEMINISETWAFKGLRFQMPGFYCRCATEIKLPAAPQNCYIGTEHGQILMLTATLDLFPKT